MKDFPIMIRNCNRGRYLVHTLNSLLSTDYNGDIYILDDISDDYNTKKFLYTDQMVQFNFNIHDEYMNENLFSYEDKQICKYQFRKLPVIKSVKGLKNHPRIKVIKPNKKFNGDKSSFIYAICYMFELYQDLNAVIIGEQDIIYHKDWYKKAYEVYKNEKNNFGVINTNTSVIEYSFKEDYIMIYNAQAYSFAWFISRKIYDIIKKYGVDKKEFKSKQDFFKIHDGWNDLPNTSKDYNIGGDAYVSFTLSSQHGLKNYILNKSYVQHIGIKTSAWTNHDLKKNLRFMHNFIGDYEYDYNLLGNYIKE